MDRINTATKALDLFGAGKHGFKDGDLALSIQPTDLEAAYFNDLQEELMAVIEGAGLAPTAGVRNQVRQAIEVLIARATGNDYKASVRAATLGTNITLAGGAPNTLDGVALAANDRILVKDQTAPSQNGLYYVSTLGTGANGTWTRSTDADQAGELTSGAIVAVEEGSTNADSQWMLTTDGTITIGTTSLTFTRKDAVATAVVQVRQTVASGSVDANGQPNFLSAGTGLSVNLAATSVPVTYNIAAGFGANGPIDYVLRDPLDIAAAWSSLTASSTLFLYVDRNASTAAKTYGFSALQPLYQPTAPAAPATDQHWFDMMAFTMKRWTGSAWSVVQRVFIGEAVTGVSSVTSVTTYALNGRYRSAVSSPLPGISTAINFNHNLGINTEAIFGSFRFYAQNITSEQNWPAGATLEPDATGNGTGFGVRSTGITGRNTASATSGSNGSGWQSADRSTGAIFQLTVNRWGYFATLSRGW